MKLYNSYSEKIEDINLDEFNIYNCGPTVYNHIHIGNARPLIIFDVLHRFLLATGKKVNFLHNLTDIDDKIINEAIKQGKKELEISSYYAKQYQIIREKLNTLPLHIEKVSDHINGIIDYVQAMITKGIAYHVNGNVYFDTSKVSVYGHLSNRKLDDQLIGERVALTDEKKNETDFVLWKKTNIGIQWETPWGLGRPGWHSECSYLIEKHFNNNLTIHGGGIDLKFPHHENENAQHYGLHNCGLSKIWMHIGHININNEKMSKSLNNFIYVKDILETYSYQVVRWFMYKTNYQNPLNFNNNIMEICNNEIHKLNNNINYLKTILINAHAYELNEKILDEEFISYLANNLNITNAIVTIQKILKDANQLIRNKQYETTNIKLNQIVNCLKILGIEFTNIHNDENIKLIKQYYEAIATKNYKESDKLREILISKGLI